MCALFRTLSTSTAAPKLFGKSNRISRPSMSIRVPMRKPPSASMARWTAAMCCRDSLCRSKNCSSEPANGPKSHLRNHRVGKLAALHFLGPVHQPGEIIGHRLGADRSIHPLDDQVGGFGPAQITEHHLAREHHRAGIDLVLAGV